MNRTELRYKRFLEDCRDTFNGRRKLSVRKLTIKHGVNNNLQTSLHKGGAIEYRGRNKPLWTGADVINTSYVKSVMSETMKYQNDSKGYQVSDVLRGKGDKISDSGQTRIPLDCAGRKKKQKGLNSDSIKIRILWGLFEYSKVLS
jgi:hypothetical protein